MTISGSGTEGSGFAIRERTGRTRSITLSDRAGPFRGPSWGVQQRSNKILYTGNPKATLQVFGYDVDIPTQIQGMWRDRYVSARGLVVVSGFTQPSTAEDLVGIFEDLVKSGSTLEVTWGFHRRIGILKRFVSKPDRVEDVAWEAEFDWASDGSSSSPRPKFPAPPSLDSVKNAMTALSDHVAFDPVDTLLAFEASLFSSINDLQSRVQDLLTSARVLAGALTLPARVVAGVTQSAMTIAFSCGQVIETIMAAPYTTMQVVDDLGSVLKAEVYRRDTASFASDLRNYALTISDSFEKRAAPDPIRVLTVDETGSLRAVAQIAYGKADAWQLLADANGFDGPFVPPGTEVFVPPSSAPSGAS